MFYTKKKKQSVWHLCIVLRAMNSRVTVSAFFFTYAWGDESDDACRSEESTFYYD